MKKLRSVIRNHQKFLWFVSVPSDTNFRLVALILGYIFFGSTYWIAAEYQDEVICKGIGCVPPAATNHSWSQNVQLYLGMILLSHLVSIASCCFLSTQTLSHHLKKNKGTPPSIIHDDSKPTKNPPSPSSPNPLPILIPSILCLLANFCEYVGIAYISPRIFQMFRSTIILFTGLFQVLLLRSPNWRFPHFYICLALIAIGNAVMAYSPYSIVSYGQYQRDTVIGGSLVVGIGFTCLAEMFYGLQYTAEEYLLKQRAYGARKLLFWEAMFCGSVTMGFVLFSLYWIQGSTDGSQSLESFPCYLVQLWICGWPLMLFVCCGMIFGSLYEFLSLVLEKEFSALSRVIVDSLKLCVLWIFAILLNPKDFRWWQVLGLIVLIVGAIVGSEILMGWYCPWYVRKVEGVRRKERERRRERVEQKRMDNRGCWKRIKLWVGGMFENDDEDEMVINQLEEHRRVNLNEESRLLT